MKKQIANIITSCRILLSITLLFCPVFSVCFYDIYLLCGFTDMVDGTIARKTNSASEFGARLDTISDFIFFVVSFIKLLPVIHIPKWMLVWVVVIAIIKICNVILGFIYKKKLISLHTVMNKITGLLLFLLPPSLQLVEIKYSLIAVCIVATFSAIQEGYYIRTGQEVSVLWNLMKNYKACEKIKGLHKKNLQKLSMCPEQQFLNGNQAEDIQA